MNRGRAVQRLGDELGDEPADERCDVWAQLVTDQLLEHRDGPPSFHASTCRE